MPLPTALLAKLSKRGILASPNLSKGIEKQSRDFNGVACCPNKSNIFHDCTAWCQTHWKIKAAPEPKYAHNVKIMLEKYPLPHNWTEIFDKGIGCYYYWNMESNLVAWLPPKHPKSLTSECAAKLRRKMYIVPKEDEPEQEKNRRKPSRSERKEKDREREREDDRKRKYEEKDRHRKKQRKDEVDPMDPAAYSDIPKGTWSDGLEQNKTKADTTASGALFQQRPYPSPGDVLSANSKQKKKK